MKTNLRFMYVCINVVAWREYINPCWVFNGIGTVLSLISYVLLHYILLYYYIYYLSAMLLSGLSTISRGSS